MLRNKTVLFADSNRTFLMLVGVLMKRLGLDCINASNGEEALAIIKDRRPDLAVLDRNLEGVDGVEALKRIKSNGNRNELPVVIISDDHEPGTIEYCRSLGCNSYLTKPLVMRELHDAIQDALFTRHGTNRKNMRIDASLKVQVSYDDVVENIFTETVSEGGVYLKLDDPIPVGKDVRIRFNLAKHGSVELNGRVIYNKRLATDNFDIPPGSAVQFVDMTDEQADTMTRLVSGLIAGDIIAAQNGQFLSS